MPNGLTPYDKKVYKESRRRCRQAFRAAETGKITPIGRTKRRVITVIICIGVVAFLTVVAFFVFQYFDDKQTYDSIVQQNDDGDLLITVNRSSPLDSSYVPELKGFDGFYVNKLMYDSLESMINDAQSQGISLTITKAYVSYDEQEKLYEQKLAELMSDSDYTEVKAEAEARRSVPMAGESEFQTGLLAEFDLSDTVAVAYIERNCVKYGFILRYPVDKEDITGIETDNAVYRYVGVDNAVNMRSYNMCLEEYCDYLAAQRRN